MYHQRCRVEHGVLKQFTKWKKQMEPLSLFWPHFMLLWKLCYAMYLLQVFEEAMTVVVFTFSEKEKVKSRQCVFFLPSPHAFLEKVISLFSNSRRLPIYCVEMWCDDDHIRGNTKDVIDDAEKTGKICQRLQKLPTF